MIKERESFTDFGVLGSVMSEVMARLSEVESVQSGNRDPESVERISRASRVPAAEREPEEPTAAETELRNPQVPHRSPSSSSSAQL